MASQPSDKDKIESKAVPTVEQLPFRLIEKHSNKTTQLVANSGKTKAVEGQHRWYTYAFKEPVFIYRIVINVSNYPDHHNFLIEADLESGKTVKNSASPRSGKVYLEVNAFCFALRFRPPKAYWSIGKTIDSVEVYGFTRGEAGKFIQFARDIDSFKGAAIEEIERREAQYQEKIERAAVAEAATAEAVK